MHSCSFKIGAAGSVEHRRERARPPDQSRVSLIYPEGSHSLRTMEDDSSFLGSTYTLHLHKSKGYGDGVRGYCIQFEPRPAGPTVTMVFKDGEAYRSGLLQPGDVLMQVNGNAVHGRHFMQVMDEIVAQDQCSFTFAAPQQPQFQPQHM